MLCCSIHSLEQMITSDCQPSFIISNDIVKTVFFRHCSRKLCLSFSGFGSQGLKCPIDTDQLIKIGDIDSLQFIWIFYMWRNDINDREFELRVLVAFTTTSKTSQDIRNLKHTGTSQINFSASGLLSTSMSYYSQQHRPINLCSSLQHVNISTDYCLFSTTILSFLKIVIQSSCLLKKFEYSMPRYDFFTETSV